MYSIRVSDKAIKDLDKLNDKDYTKVKSKLITLETNPKPMGSIKLKGKNGYRVRTGDYRILYEVDDKSKTIDIYKVEHRKDAYRKR